MSQMGTVWYIHQHINSDYLWEMGLQRIYFFILLAYVTFKIMSMDYFVINVTLKLNNICG